MPGPQLWNRLNNGVKVHGSPVGARPRWLQNSLDQVGLGRVRGSGTWRLVGALTTGLFISILCSYIVDNK